ncbi:hypothetical protein BGZ65_007069, partial [Modicella reniformis]
MTEHDLSDSTRILASISNGSETAPGVLATVVNLGGGSGKSQHPAMTSDDLQGTLAQAQSH